MHLIGYDFNNILEFTPDQVYYSAMSTIGNYIKSERKKAGLTQEEFAMRSGLGLRFVRELEQGKATVRLDKVNQALAMFGMEAVPGRKRCKRWLRTIALITISFVKRSLF